MGPLHRFEFETPALIYVVLQETNFVVVVSDGLLKTGKSGTQWYCVIPGMFSVPCTGVPPEKL